MDTVKLRNISDQDLHLGPLAGRLVEKDCVVEVPGTLVQERDDCLVIGADPGKGHDWAAGDPDGVLLYPKATWSLEATPKRKTKSEE